MILISMWLLNFALAAAILVALVQKRKHQKKEEKQKGRNETGDEAEKR